MGKDPALLWYVNDWMGGTVTFSRAHKGAYMDLLMAQFNHGHMALEDIKNILGPDFESMWISKLANKFKIDSNGCYYNEKLENEQLKRKNYTQSRRNNLTDMGSHKKAHMGLHMVKHMENENEREVLLVWNKEEIVIHSSIDSVKGLAASIRGAIKRKSDVSIIHKAIANYSAVLKSEKHYWNHKWNLKDFLDRGLDKFVDDAEPLINFLNKNNGVLNAKTIIQNPALEALEYSRSRREIATSEARAIAEEPF